MSDDCVPVIRSGDRLGASSYTTLKQSQFRLFLRTHLGIAKAIFAKHVYHSYIPDPPYLYIDMNAGAGKYIYEASDGSRADIVGSPLIFMEETIKAHLQFKAYFVEEYPEYYKHLAFNLEDEYGYYCRSGSVQYHCGNHDTVFREKFIGNATQRLGLIYFDSNGSPAAKNGVTLLRLLSSLTRYKKTDLLYHFSARAVKRSRKAHNTKSIAEIVNAVDKKCWLIRKGEHPRQDFTFLVGSNWNAFPDFNNLGFVRLHSKEGRAEIARLDMTVEERSKGQQPPLF